MFIFNFKDTGWYRIFRDIDFYWESTKTKDLNSQILVLDSMNKLDLGNHAVAILTEWEVFKNVDFSKIIVFDGRGVISSSTYSIGKGWKKYLFLQQNQSHLPVVLKTYKSIL